MKTLIKAEKELIKFASINMLIDMKLDLRKLFIQVVESSRSGMSHNLQVLAIENNEIKDISREVAYAIECTYTKDGFIRIPGCGYSKELYIREALKNALK